VEDYWQRAESNLRAGRIRLVFAADRIPEELRAIIEFVNEKMADVEVFGVEIRRYAAKGENECYVPRLIGATAAAIQSKRVGREAPLASVEDFLELVDSKSIRSAAKAVIEHWTGSGGRIWRYKGHIALIAQGPAANGWRVVVALYPDGSVVVPFSSYRGANTGVAIEALCTDEFRERAQSIFAFSHGTGLASTTSAWLTPANAGAVGAFCQEVAAAFAAATKEQASTGN
jgi:hypothetical protein